MSNPAREHAVGTAPRATTSQITRCSLGALAVKYIAADATGGAVK